MQQKVASRQLRGGPRHLPGEAGFAQPGRDPQAAGPAATRTRGGTVLGTAQAASPSGAARGTSSGWGASGRGWVPAATTGLERGQAAAGAGFALSSGVPPRRPCHPGGPLVSPGVTVSPGVAASAGVTRGGCIGRAGGSAAGRAGVTSPTRRGAGTRRRAATRRGRRRAPLPRNRAARPGRGHGSPPRRRRPPSPPPRCGAVMRRGGTDLLPGPGPCGAAPLRSPPLLSARRRRGPQLPAARAGGDRAGAAACGPRARHRPSARPPLRAGPRPRARPSPRPRGGAARRAPAPRSRRLGGSGGVAALAVGVLGTERLGGGGVLVPEGASIHPGCGHPGPGGSRESWAAAAGCRRGRGTPPPSRCLQCRRTCRESPLQGYRRWGLQQSGCRGCWPRGRWPQGWERPREAGTQETGLLAPGTQTIRDAAVGMCGTLAPGHAGTQGCREYCCRGAGTWGCSTQDAGVAGPRGCMRLVCRGQEQPGRQCPRCRQPGDASASL